jgi:hypothetical protein
METMKKFYMLTALLLATIVLLSGCSKEQPAPVQNQTTSKITTVAQLIPTATDLAQLRMMSNGSDCQIDAYETGPQSPLAAYSICFYTVPNLNGTEVIIEMSKYTNKDDLQGSYEYSSSHLQGSKGIISLNTFGDQSRFSHNSDDDYGAQYNDPAIKYYHLWIIKDLYLIHITSKGPVDAQDHISAIGKTILQKFG